MGFGEGIGFLHLSHLFLHLLYYITFAFFLVIGLFSAFLLIILLDAMPHTYIYLSIFIYFTIVYTCGFGFGNLFGYSQL